MSEYTCDEALRQLVARVKLARAWARMSERARVHLTGLDPRTDRLAIVRWHNRWVRSLYRARQALARVATHSAAVMMDAQQMLAVAENCTADEIIRALARGPAESEAATN